MAQLTEFPQARTTSTGYRDGWPLTLAAVAIIGCFLFPVYWMINISLQGGSSAAVSATWLPLRFDTSGYAVAMAEQGQNLITSLIVASGAVGIVLLFSVPIAFALSTVRSIVVDAILVAIVLAQMVPGVVIANSVYVAFNALGLLNSHLGLMIADASIGLPFAILVIRTFMLAIPKEIIEAARVDGAGYFRILLLVVVPISRNAIITAGLFAFLFAWSDFLFAASLSTSDSVRPITVGIYQYLSTYVSSWSSVMATAVLASLPAAILLITAQRFIAVGVTGGAVK